MNNSSIRQGSFGTRVPANDCTADNPVVDRLGRPLRDLRLSITDRCNFRCNYCMPESVHFADEVLTLDEIADIASAFRHLGAQKLRVTGGEPLVRRDVVDIVARLAKCSFPDLCMTTNGSLMARLAPALAGAGLNRVTISLDALDQPTFERMSGTAYSVRQVLAGIDAARAAGLSPLKINTVVKRGVNDHVIEQMARWAERERLEVRYIEFMNVGHSNDWSPEHVVTAAEILAQLREQFNLVPLSRCSQSDTAECYTIGASGATVGVIASVSKPFCENCSSVRVSAKGLVHACLFAEHSIDLKALLRCGQPLVPALTKLWNARHDRYSQTRALNAESTTAAGNLPRAVDVSLKSLIRPHRGPEMSTIGG